MKYYVCTGDYRCVMEGDDAKEAALKAFDGLEESNCETLGSVTLVSQHGFESTEDDDVWIPTMDLLEQSGQISNFRHKDGF